MLRAFVEDTLPHRVLRSRLSGKSPSTAALEQPDTGVYCCSDIDHEVPTAVTTAVFTSAECKRLSAGPLNTAAALTDDTTDRKRLPASKA
ncbi:hypothetical protein H257_13372, partial [Aphanomyces astaci]